MPESSLTRTSRKTTQRTDSIEIDVASLWTVLSQSPGIGVSITDVEGRLLFVNDTTMVLFSETLEIDYAGKLK